MKNRRRQIMAFALCAIAASIILFIIWFSIPYSPMKRAFRKDTEYLIAEGKLHETTDVFTEDVFSHLPKAIQKYVEGCGYIGKRKMSYMKMEYKDVSFSLGKDRPTLTMDYTQYNFVDNPSRLAYIDSSLFGIPFEGYDYYQNGKGGMKGMIGKAITLFNEVGPDMDKACLVTYLAESLFAPSILLEPYITFEEISEYEVKATISHNGIEASGIFRFNSDYEMVSFTTNDRAITNSDGTMEYVPWSALCSSYQSFPNGIKYPTSFKAVWNYSDGDYTYFDGRIFSVSYDT